MCVVDIFVQTNINFQFHTRVFHGSRPQFIDLDFFAALIKTKVICNRLRSKSMSCFDLSWFSEKIAYNLNDRHDKIALVPDRVE